MRCLGSVLPSLLSLYVPLSVPLSVHLIVPLFCLLLSDVFHSIAVLFLGIFYENGMTFPFDGFYSCGVNLFPVVQMCNCINHFHPLRGSQKYSAGPTTTQRFTDFIYSEQRPHESHIILSHSLLSEF